MNTIIDVNIQEQQSVFSINETEYVSVPVGFQTLSAQCFSNFPPTYDEVDAAINITEEALQKVQGIFTEFNMVRSSDTQLQSILDLAFNVKTETDGSRYVATIEIEQVFERLSNIIKGLPASQDVIPASNEFAAYLLILREILHHLKMKGVIGK